MSKLYVNSELDLFALPPVQTQIQDSFWEEITPVSSNVIPDDGYIEFMIPSNEDYYVDFERTELCVQGRVVHGNGTFLNATDIVAPVNQLLHALFSQINVELNNVPVTTTYNTYPYLAYADSLFNYSTDMMKVKGPEENFYPDEYEVNDIIDIVHCTPEMAQRIQSISRSKLLTMHGDLKLALARSGRYIPNLVDIKIRILRSRPEFYLIWKPTRADIAAAAALPIPVVLEPKFFKFRIEKMTLQVRKVKLFPEVADAHLKVSRTHNFVYQIPQIDVQEVTINAGSRNFLLTNLFGGRRPKSIIFGLVKNSAFNGNSEENPYRFEHFDLESSTLYVNGNSRPFPTIITNYDIGDFLFAERSLRRGLNPGINGIPAPTITRDNYDKGYAFYVYNISADLDDDDDTLNQKCNIRLDLIFRKALQQAVSLILFASFNNLITIDLARQVKYTTFKV